LSVYINALKNLRCNDGDLFIFENLEMFVLRPFEFPGSLAGKRYVLLKLNSLQTIKSTDMFYISLEWCA